MFFWGGEKEGEEERMERTAPPFTPPLPTPTPAGLFSLPPLFSCALRLFKDDPFNSQRGATDLGEEGLRFFPAQKTQRGTPPCNLGVAF